MGNSQRVPVHPCPYCGLKNDAVTGMFGARDPHDGDMSICAYCLRPAVFVETLGTLAVRVMTDEEQAAAKDDPKLARVLGSLEKVRGGK